MPLLPLSCRPLTILWIGPSPLVRQQLERIDQVVTQTPSSTVAMRANVRQGDSSHPINRRDDPPQEVSALCQNLLCDAQTASVILCHFVVISGNSFNGPLTKLFFLPMFFLRILLVTILHCEVGTTHCLGAAICIRTSFDLFQNLSEGRFLLPLTLYPFLFFPSSVRQIISLAHALSRVKYTHIPRRSLFTLHHLP